MPSSTWFCPVSVAAAALIAGLPCAAQSTQRVSLDYLGSPAPFGVHAAPYAISGDGSRVAFPSGSALVPDDTNGVVDIYIADRTSGTVTRASVDSFGMQASEGSEYLSISANGRFVAFASTAADLVPNDPLSWSDIFLHDLQLGTTVMVSVNDQGQQGGKHSNGTSVSADGSRVAFSSQAKNLAPGDGNGHLSDVFARDVVAGTTHRVSVSSTGQGGNSNSGGGLISADGRFVAFGSSSDNLVAGDAGEDPDVFVHELATGRTTRVSMGINGAEPDGPCFVESISADGRFVSFQGYATNLVPGDTNGVEDVFVHDRLLGTTERVNVSTTGTQTQLESRGSHLSGDGRYVTFESRAKSLAPNGSGNQWQVYLRDRLTGVTTRESVDANGEQGLMGGRFPAISLDAGSIAFWSWEDELVSSDFNGAPDMFVRDLAGCAPTVANYCVASSTSLPGCSASVSTTGQPSLSAPASFRVSSGAIPGGLVGVAYFGVEGASLTPVGTQGGLLCVGGARYPAVPRTSGGTLGQCDGELQYGLDEWLTAQPDLIGAGAVVHASFWFRDPGSPDGFGLSNGVWFQVCP